MKALSADFDVEALFYGVKDNAGEWVGQLVSQRAGQLSFIIIELMLFCSFRLFLYRNKGWYETRLETTL
jgi:hypothetical protein